MDLLTTSQVAELWGVSRRLVTRYCTDGRIEGAMHIGNMWMIPKNAKKPEDPRKVAREMKKS